MTRPSPRSGIFRWGVHAFQAGIPGIPALTEHVRGRQAFLLHERMNPLKQVLTGDADDPPGLAKPDARCRMRRLQQALKGTRVNRQRQEMPHVAAIASESYRRGELVTGGTTVLRRKG